MPLARYEALKIHHLCKLHHPNKFLISDLDFLQVMRCAAGYFVWLRECAYIRCCVRDVVEASKQKVGGGVATPIAK